MCKVFAQTSHKPLSCGVSVPRYLSIYNNCKARRPRTTIRDRLICAETLHTQSWLEINLKYDRLKEKSELYIVWMKSSMWNKVLLTYLCVVFCTIVPVWSGNTTEIQFIDVTETAGIHFQHAGGIDQRVVPALVGSGAAWRDYDNNGTLDLYIVNSTAVRPEPDTILPKNVLYRNNGGGTFTDVTDIAGVGDTGWGMGCVFADYDNDGDADLYVTNYKANVFYLNKGDATFKKFTSGAGGIGHKGFGAGVAWGDFDTDGFLELYVGNYIEYTKVPQGDEVFFPYDFFGQTNIFYLNKGDGGFIEITDSAKINGGFHLTLGVAAADYDNDGDLDIYLANDSDQNILYRNDGDMTFMNTNQPDARSRTGDIRSGMGIAWGDYNNDGALDLFVTNWLDENNVLYRNNGDGTFTDVSAKSGIFESGLGKTCWGTVFFDMDNDTDLDLFFSAGHIDPATWKATDRRTFSCVIMEMEPSPTYLNKLD